MSDTFYDVYQSFNRCLQKRDFLSRFYTIFTHSDPKIAARFDQTDWSQQIQLLRHGISSSILFASASDLGDHELKRLYKSHGKKGLRIPPWMYTNWLEALIKTLGETDPQFDKNLEQRWRDTMGMSIAMIRDGRDVRSSK